MHYGWIDVKWTVRDDSTTYGYVDHTTLCDRTLIIGLCTISFHHQAAKQSVAIDTYNARSMESSNHIIHIQPIMLDMH